MSYNKLTDGSLIAWLNNFVNVATANAAALGIDAPDQAEIDAARDDFTAAYNAKVAAAAAALSATAGKDIERANSLTVVGKFNAEWQANPAIAQTLIGELGLTIRADGLSKVGVFTPLKFVATGNGNGEVKMKWDRNGNKWGCTFTIEVSYDSGDSWQVVTSTTQAKKTLTGVTIRPAVYRVRAERNAQFSAPSSGSAIYVPAGEAAPVEPSLGLVA